MEIKFADNSAITCILASGEKQYVQGATRDTITFTFSEDVSLDTIDSTFTESRCEKLTVSDGTNEYVHNGYSIRASLLRKPIQTAEATSTAEATYENRVQITLAQKTYAETKLTSLAEENEMISEVLDTLLME